ncbi:1,2-dihydroxy-3-keto-5-methylthiopentene dioxygenase [Sphingomonas sp. BE270]|jgi:1,2-dihydroxy-3-keto-5-methylthiopentene dioxygenase|uniref:1,2-dihydroxy-3-keto-5-methylthiopentene dioxygenase n=1 Tax=unclassified Sphingomonas TaxID=196159 RepID=UPI00053E9AFD|nr:MULTISPECIES: cupin [unclassified Sphingomonas]MDR6847136.1 1,2-dihydroxy-3-keto-5-methylthiopentene dioxygenase [Sphingomonas sp. BE137]MDR7256736.1 1,2-dihydroxy-3-keto-5-methylthiopentene dioxygenase [Sphingomonas sp. BE270]RUN76305.1 cupin [Sphingomonas sp. TF3]
MSRLQVFAEDDAATPLLDTTDAAEIEATLQQAGVRFERWPLKPVTTDSDVLTVYADEVARLTAEGGYQSIDVARIAPDHPDRATLREKFLSEHTHGEDEVRFFIDGEGLFTLHHDGRVFNMLCCAGDLISVPAGMRHWFDMGAAPRFTAIRLFVNPDGWVAAFTGSDIAERFPRLEPATA